MQGRATRTPIRPITGRRSLLPASHTCIAIRVICNRHTHGFTHCTTCEGPTGLPPIVNINSTDGVRTPLCTEWFCECAGPPLKLACLTTIAFWLWSRKVALAPLLSRYVIPRLHLCCPYPSFPAVSVSVLLTAYTFTECSEPHRCQ